MLDVRCFTKDLCDLYVFVEILRRAKRVELDDFASKATKLDDLDEPSELNLMIRCEKNVEMCGTAQTVL